MMDKEKKMEVVIQKLTRRKDAENPHWSLVPTGALAMGAFGVMKKDLVNEGDISATNPNDPDNYDYPNHLFARIGQCVMVNSPPSDRFLRTSRIRSYYIHETDGTHPDKLVLPQGFPIEDLKDLKLDNLIAGDMLLATQNSIYLVRKNQD